MFLGGINVLKVELINILYIIMCDTATHKSLMYLEILIGIKLGVFVKYTD